MDICESHKALTREVADFLLNVKEVKEESITDYLVWKWKEIDKRFKSINVSTFTRQEESALTGADFEIELWLIGKTRRYPLVIQAKKFIKPYDSYVSKLKYPSNTKGQMNKLLGYSAKNNKIPFYAFYSLPDYDTKAMCRRNDVAECGVFLAHAEVIEEFAEGKHGTRVSKNNLLAKSNPFHCIFCCPLSETVRYFEKYYSVQGIETQESDSPIYVDYLLRTHPLEVDEEYVKTLIEEYKLGIFKYVAVYDIRELEKEPRKA
ncbi:MAG: hypothetical protein GY814_10855 [Gammaproteobacteria bacterium]|nr:hypothetical protein [Gammaproteobacteria bacterium]